MKAVGKLLRSQQQPAVDLPATRDLGTTLDQKCDKPQANETDSSGC